jgi:hypothetical protein
LEVLVFISSTLSYIIIIPIRAISIRIISSRIISIRIILIGIIPSGIVYIIISIDIRVAAEVVVVVAILALSVVLPRLSLFSRLLIGVSLGCLVGFLGLALF